MIQVFPVNGNKGEMIMKLKIILIIGIIFSAYTGFGVLQYSRMSNIEKCVLQTQIAVLNQSVFDAKFYEEQPILERICKQLNKSEE